MAFLTMTYSFANSTVADAAAVNTNFQDVIDALSDGTLDQNIAALTCAGATVINHNVTLGNSSSRDLTINASLASSIAIKTTRTYDIGSADLGLRILYLAGNSTHTIALQAPSSGMAADYSLNLPPTAPVVGFVPQASSTSAVVWAPGQTDINAVSAASYTVTDTDGYSLIAMTTGASSFTVTLPTAADNTDRTLIIKKADSGAGTVTVDGEGAETIEGAATFILYKQYESITIKCDGTTWHLINFVSPISTYSPTPANSTNVSASTGYTTYYRRLDNTRVYVWGRVDIDPTSGVLGTASRIFLPLPIASNIGGTDDCFGQTIGGAGAGNMYQAGIIVGDAAGDRARFDFNADDATNQQHNFWFIYTII